ncbi:hypothetical protein [uncultured Methanocorpusculum sp.]|nr:hypothetical protein [uncultured Methanocorpusculum sp.]
MTDEIDESRLNKKDITSEIVGFCFDDETPAAIVDQDPAWISGGDPQISEEENPLIPLIDVGLDFAEDILKEQHLPELKREIWESHGKKAMSKALNAYCPPGSALGGAMNAPLTALMIGIVALLMCFYPRILKLISDKRAALEHPDEQEELRSPTQAARGYVETYEEPRPTKVTSTALISERAQSISERLAQAGEIA